MLSSIIINTFGCYLACFAALIAAFGYLVSSCFGNTMYYTTPLFFIFLGMGNMPFAEADETQSEK